jgi:hypothetical protein
MPTPPRFKLRLLLILVLVAATALGAVAMVRRSLDYASKAGSAENDMNLHLHSAELAGYYEQLHRKLSESATNPDGSAHAKHQAEVSMREKSYFEEQAARAAWLKEAYGRLASHPWESEPASIEEARRRMLDAKHPTFP